MLPTKEMNWVKERLLLYQLPIETRNSITAMRIRCRVEFVWNRNGKDEKYEIKQHTNVLK